MKRFYGVLLMSSLISCTTYSGGDEMRFPTYQYDGIDLLAEVDAEISLSDRCPTFRTPQNSAETIIVWPQGTRVVDGVAMLPIRNGGARIADGDTVTLRGGYNEISSESVWLTNNPGCAGPAFILNSAARK